MITLNILPEHKRREYEVIQISRFLLSFFEALLFVTCCAAILLVMARISLRNRVTSIFQPAVVIERSTEKLEREVESLNALLRAMDSVQEKSNPWSPLLLELSHRTPPTVHVTSLQQTSATTLDIRGRADTRNDLLEFKNRLTDSPWLTNLKFPVTNLIAREQVPFEISATIRRPDTP